MRFLYQVILSARLLVEQVVKISIVLCAFGAAQMSLARQSALGLVVSGRIFPTMIMKGPSNSQLLGLTFPVSAASFSSNNHVLTYGPVSLKFEQIGMTALAFSFKEPSRCTVGDETLSDGAVKFVFNNFQIDPINSIQVPLDLSDQTFVLHVKNVIGSEFSGADLSCEPGELIYSY